MKVPYFDLERAVAPLSEELLARWKELLAKSSFIGGSEVQAFEASFSEVAGTPGCVGVANGTDALHVALRALDLEPGDEVIVPDFTFIATAAAVVLAGGRPVLTDVEPETLNIDPARVEASIGPRTVGVIGVHLYGRPFDLDRLEEICRQHGLWLIEDAAQAQGARWGGRPVGSFGRLATWSFYPSKNLGAFGDAGAVTGMDLDLLERVRRVANHGRVEHYRHSEVGTNSRLDALQAAVLNIRLKTLEADNARRRRIAAMYRERLADLEGLGTLEDSQRLDAVYHQFVLLSPQRDDLGRYLAEREIGSGIHYPLPLHLQPSFSRWLDAAAEFQVSARAAREVLCLPMFPQLTDEEVEWVCAAVRGFFTG